MALTEPLSPAAIAQPGRKQHLDVDLTTTRPGTPGGIFMRRFWHAIGRSDDLAPGRALPIRVMSEDYTVYRGTTGTAHVIAQRCPHRGAQMHLGWVEADDIRCVYHGWKYDCSGRCIESPAEREGFERNVQLATYPTAEAFGLIYAYFGPDEAPPFPPYPESHGEGIIEAWPIEQVPCNYLQSFENTMDEVHVAFTHSPGGSHARLAQNLPIISAEETAWGMIRYGKRASGMVRHTLHYAPNIVRVIVPPLSGMDDVGGWPEITFHFTPVDDENHLWLVSAKVKVTGDDAVRYREKRREFYAKRAAAPPVNDVVRDIWAGKIAYADVRHPDLAIVQDIAVQAGQGRVADRAAETLGRSDAGIAVWRRILERELRAIAAGGPAKRWERAPDDVIPIVESRAREMAISDRPGSRATQTRNPRYSVDLATTKPGTPGGTFMRQFWHPIVRSVDLLPGRALPVRRMNEDFTVYRGENGVPHVVAARCPHRGALMHLGWIENDDIRCVYHGWKYDGTGRCVETPAEKAGFEKNVRIGVYPTGEAFGLVYAYFGPGEPPAFPPYPESHGEGIIEAWVPVEVPCNYLQSFENSMDEVHVAFTHSPGGSHAALAQELPIITAEETPWGMLRFGRRGNGLVRHTLHYAPNIVRVIVPPQAGMDGVGGWPEITFHFVPVDDENHLWFNTTKVQVTGADVEPYRKKRAEFYEKRAGAPDVRALVEDIWAARLPFGEARHPELARVQDIAVQAGQGRIENRETETLGRSDAGIAVWRRILERELQTIAEGGVPKVWERPPADVIPIVGT